MTAKAVNAAYDGLITLIKKVYSDHQHVQKSVDHLTKKPEDKNRRAALEAELKDAGVKVDKQFSEA